MKSHKPQATSLKQHLISRHAVSRALSPIIPILPINPMSAQSAVSALPSAALLISSSARPPRHPRHGSLALFASLGSLFALFLLSGCATEKIAEGLATKNTSGNGTVVDTHVGINTETKIPELRTLFISGDFATVKAGTNAVSYREESSASVWNASSVTKKRFLSITLTDPGDVPAAIKAVAEVFKTAEAAAAKPETEVKAAK